MATGVLVAVFVALQLASFLYLRASMRRRTDPDRILAAYGDEVERMVQTIDAATDRDTRLVEERVKTLRSLLEETDRRLQTLVRELDRRALLQPAGEAPAGLPVSIPPASAPPAPAPPDSAPSAPAAVQSEERETGPAISLTRIRRAQEQIRPAPPSFSEQVARLHRQGLSAEAIARSLKAAEAEVEFAVALIDSNWHAGEE